MSGALALLGLPLYVRRRWDTPSNEYQLVAITLYDTITSDMGVGGNCLFTAVAIAGFAWQYAWIFLLLDVLLISDDLQNLLKAVIIPWRQLVLALPRGQTGRVEHCCKTVFTLSKSPAFTTARIALRRARSSSLSSGMSLPSAAARPATRCCSSWFIKTV